MVCYTQNVNGTKYYAQKLKNSTGNIFIKWSQGKMSGSPLKQSKAKKKKKKVLALFMLIGIVQKLSV
jgi:hypothetical protein